MVTKLLINLLRPPVLWALDSLAEYLRKRLPHWQRCRFESNGNPYLAKLCQNARSLVHEWDRTRELMKDIEARFPAKALAGWQKHPLVKARTGKRRE